MDSILDQVEHLIKYNQRTDIDSPGGYGYSGERNGNADAKIGYLQDQIILLVEAIRLLSENRKN
jgi:hypothetical protein